ncbi:protein patched homolog 1-like isoform X2 [Varroa destructor]|uniref:SSD domain-containing protein n=1 Tax=Varroa destructor TaxID=109461 RepID=A0A7M7J9K0_VARDE|nr:protein patched homolog 1-like isoform X2 [Varroa destructor]XP_022648723.1 protein patched homolog 1-like isoform X2 [Varroa destructor]
MALADPSGSSVFYGRNGDQINIVTTFSSSSLEILGCSRTLLQVLLKERARGNQASLWLRKHLQVHLYEVGCGIQRNPGKILFVGLLILAIFCVGLKSVRYEYELEKLWIEEGGRVTRELEYIRTKLGVSAADSQQIIIQSSSPDISANILRYEALLTHVDLLREALQIEVDVFGQSWSLQDLCIKASVPAFNHHFIDQIFENIMPCIIETPLDCFWEGSKLLSPWYPLTIETFGIQNLTWLNLNPTRLMKTMIKTLGTTDFPFESMENFMARSGITTAYQKRPCLNPDDPECPETAPNKKSRILPDIGAALTGGCYGFATTDGMHWPESLIVGGIQKNRSGLITRAGALQTIIQLMDDKTMFDFHDGRYNLHNADWSIEKAREVIVAWQNKFTNEIKRLSKLARYQQQCSNVFTLNTLTNVLRKSTTPDIELLLIGAALVLIYVSIALVNLERPELSQGLTGFVGVLLLALSITAAFGLCAMLGLPFNATTTQVLPFLGLGLGCNSIFMLTHTLNKIVSSGSVTIERQTGECLKRTGVSIILSNASLILAFFLAAWLIPIPALRYFSLQAAILFLCSLTATLFLFPAVFSLDLRRRAARRLDLFCCVVKNDDVQKRSKGPFATEMEQQARYMNDELFVKPVAIILTDENQDNELRFKRQRGIDDGCFGWSLSLTAAEYYVPLIRRPVVRALVLLSFISLATFGLWGSMRLEDGLELSGLVPKSSNEYEYMRHQQRFFGVYRIFAITQANFEYPTNQRLLYEYHDAFTRVEKIVKNDDGGLPGFWLSHFRDWLLDLQKTFDIEWNQGYIKLEGWNQSASNDAILAYKLLLQTGRTDNPVDKRLLTSNRLVKEDGIINPKAFYHYLTAWYNKDPLMYSSSQASLVPQPKQWDDIPRAQELKIPKSSAIQFAQLPFYLRDLNSTREITATISQLRLICARFEERGLPNFPTGLPFLYWEQYLHLRFYLGVATTLILVTVFIVISSVLLNLWSALLIVFVLAACVVQALGTLHILGMSLSAVPAVLIVISVGMGVNTTLHLTIGYLTALGGRTRRISMALEYMSTPIIHATVTTLLGVAMLLFSEFDFVVKHFSHLLSAIVVIHAYNGFVVLPVLLTYIGPSGDLVPHNNRDKLEFPIPRPSPALKSRTSTAATRPRSRFPHNDRGRTSKKSSFLSRTQSELSLSTITEEPSSYQSTSPEPETSPAKIVVEPEITVETTTITKTASGLIESRTSRSTGSSNGGENNPSPTPSSASSGVESGTNSPTVVTTTDVTPYGTNVTTKVTTTAKVKVELHAPFMQRLHHNLDRADHWNRDQFNIADHCRPLSRRSYRTSSGDMTNTTSYDRTESSVNSSLPSHHAAYPCYYSRRR